MAVTAVVVMVVMVPVAPTVMMVVVPRTPTPVTVMVVMAVMPMDGGHAGIGCNRVCGRRSERCGLRRTSCEETTGNHHRCRERRAT